MGNAVRRIQRRQKAKSRIAGLMSNPEHVIVIHYSCESFYDRANGSSPRITSIAVRNLDSGQTKSFSIHQVAERKGHSRDELEQYYDQLEKLMLDEFYEYVRVHASYKWLHWNMRDINYGFQAIAHRYRVLGGQPVDIHEADLADLPRLLVDIYGAAHIGHPRLQKLVEKNNISRRDFLNGEEEANAFVSKDYVRLHQSTLRKVEILANIIQYADNGTLKTNSSWKEIYGSYPEAIGEFIKEHWLISIIGFVGTILGIISFLLMQ